MMIRRINFIKQMVVGSASLVAVVPSVEIPPSPGLCPGLTGQGLLVLQQ